MKEGMNIGRLLDPKIDYVFKRIFGYVGNEDITCDLLNAVLKREVTNVKLDCDKILEKDLLDDKIGILDIRAKIDGNINCNIEMQVVDRKNIEKRLLFYWSKMYTSSIKEGNNYEQLEKTIVILFSDYKLDGLKKIKKYVTKWNIREEEYTGIILTDVFEIYIIELPKVNKYIEKANTNRLDFWVKFIENPEVVDVSKEDGAIRKAKEVLEEISSDDRERRLAELREKYIMDQKAIEQGGYEKGRKDGIKEGRIEGLQQGLQQGIEQNKREIVVKMKEQKIDIDVISKVTGLSVEEIEEIN
jgi:predicted transposase/invertase (TIGR01784 family)